MSTWGPRPQENDDAADWLADLEEAPSLFAVNEAFDAVLSLERDRYIEVSDGAVVVAAAAVLEMLTNDSAPLECVSEACRSRLASLWAGLAPSAKESLARRARASLAAVLTPAESELDELMSENAGLHARWRECCAGLLLSLMPKPR